MTSLSRTESKNIRSLNSRKGRRQLNQFVAEGVRVLEEAIKHGFLPEIVYYAPEMLSSRGQKLAEKFELMTIPTRELSSSQFRAAAIAKTPQGIMGVFRLPTLEVSESFSSHFRNVLVCDSIADPGNLGTLMRSALAFRFDLLLLTGASADPFSPKVVRSSAGAVFGLKMARVSHENLFELVRRQNFKLVACSKSGSHDIRKLKAVLKVRRLMLAVGSEAEGLSHEIVGTSDLQWGIHHTTSVESLNAAVAGSIVMKQIFDIER